MSAKKSFIQPAASRADMQKALELMMKKESLETSNKLATNHVETSNRTGNKTSNKLATKHGETSNKTKFQDLAPKEGLFVEVIFDHCTALGTKETDRLRLDFIARQMGANDAKSSNVVRVTIQRVLKTRLVLKTESKEGRGGWSKYQISDDCYNDLFLLKNVKNSAANWQQTSNKLATEQATEQATRSPYSSSNLNIINTTTEEVLTKKTHWLDSMQLDLFPESLISSGFQLSSTLRNKIEASDMLESNFLGSLHAFAFDLESESVKNKPNLKILLSCLFKNERYNSEGYLKHLKNQLELTRKTQELENELMQETARIKTQDQFKIWIEQNPKEAEKLEAEILIKNKALTKNSAAFYPIMINEWLKNSTEQP